MDKIVAVGAGISTPLGLAGFVAALMLLLVRLAIKADLFPSLTKQASSTALLRVINYLFALATMAMLLTAAGYLRERARPRLLSGTVATSAGMADGMLVALAGSNASTRTNQVGYFSLEVPSIDSADTVILLIGDPGHAERHGVPVRTGLEIHMADAKASRPVPVLRPELEGRKKSHVPTAATLIGDDVRIISAPDVPIADPVADLLRQRGAFVTLTRAVIPDNTRACRTVYQSSQEADAKRVRESIRDLVDCPLVLADVALSSRLILVYLPTRP